jgi:hypothetical protein
MTGVDTQSPGAKAAGRPGGGEKQASILHLLALSGLALAQPLLDLLARQPEFLAIRRFAPWQIVALAAILVLVVPLPLLAVAAAARARPRLGRTVHVTLVGGLSALLSLLALRRTPLDGGWWLAAGLVAGLAAALAYRRFGWLRQFVGLCSLGLILFPFAFLLAPGVRRQLASGAATASVPPSGARTPIVLLVADELTATDLLDESGRLDARTFPNLAALAAGATWFPRALTVSDLTEVAVPAMLTGRFPRSGSLPIARDHPQNLFTALPDYRIWAHEPITRLAPGEAPARLALEDLPQLARDLGIVYAHLLLPPAWSADLPTLSGRWSGFDSGAASDLSRDARHAEALEALHGDRAAQIDRLLDALDPDRDQALYFLHVLLPHTPWEFLPSGRRYLTPRNRVPGLIDNRIWDERESYALEAYQRYLLQAQYLDRRVGDLVRRLRETDLYDRALVVFVADHGTCFRPGESRRLLTGSNDPDILPVPLIVKRPGQRRGEVVTRRVSTLDILPTVLGEIGARPPWELGRRSLFAAEPTAAPDLVLSARRGSYAVPPDLDRLIEERLRWKHERISISGEPPARIALRRPASSPLGRPLSALALAPGVAGTVRLDAQMIPAETDATSLFAPSWISGSIRPEHAGAGCCELAIAVDGIVTATTHVDVTAGENRFGLLVPEWEPGPGPRRIEVLGFRPGRPPQLVRFADEEGGGGAAELRLGKHGRPVALLRAGLESPVRPGAIAGFFDLRRNGELMLVTGWAYDLEHKAPPREVLVFHRGHLVANGVTEGIREDVDAALGLTGSKIPTAFEIPIAASRLPEIERTGLQVIGVGGGQAASELGFLRYLRSGSDGGPAAVEFSDGRLFPVASDAIDGQLLRWHEAADGIEVEGWAWHLRLGAGAVSVVVFDGERSIFDSAAFERAPTLARRVGAPASARLHFRFRIGRKPGAATPGRPTLALLGPDGRARILEP